MSDTDDDDVAIDGGMEAEVSIEDHRAGRSGESFDGEDDDEPVHGVTSVSARGQRPISPKVRELFQKAAASTKAQLEQEGDESPFGEYDEGVEPPRRHAAEPAAAKPAEPKPEEQPAAQEQPAPAQPSAEAEAFRAQLEARRAELDEREARVAQLERASDMAAARKSYMKDGAKAVANLLRSWLPKDTSDADFQSEVGDLITDLSSQVLGVEVPSEVKSKIDAKRMYRSVDLLKSEIEATEQEKAEKAKVEAERQGRMSAVNALNREFKTKAQDLAKQFPYLSVEDDPGELIYLTAERQLKKDGTTLHWTEAAKRVDDYLRKQASDFHDKRKHLFSAAPANAGASANGQSQRPQGDPPGQRRSQTLTNDAAGATKTPRPEERNPAPSSGKWNREAHRAATREKFRNAFRDQPDE